jgi:histidine ammonia-lyase
MKNPLLFNYGIDALTTGSALAIARGELKAVLNDQAKKAIEKSRASVQSIVEDDRTVYGINTGFGPLCTTKISKEETAKLQVNLLKSHCVGVGNPIDSELVKLMMICKVHALSRGYSGIALPTVERIIWMIENDVLPIVPEQGSVGASGDLAPLSHLFLPLIGEGEVEYQGKRQPIQQVYQQSGLQPLVLGPKEGLALINGTQFILAHGVKTVEELYRCLNHADIIGALMIEALQGSAKPFEKELHELRPFKGNSYVANRIYNMLKDSEIMKDHQDCDRVQDPYSLRCIPQVHGASRNAWLHLKELVETELNSVTDNPIVFDKDHTISGGNFHGQPLAMALDYACLAASELGNISDRRIYLALMGLSHGVPKLLMEDTGINSGYMILQYTSAALASENKGLCFPSSADSISTSLGQEDHVSMGSISGRKALTVAYNTQKILAIELLTAAQALSFRRPLKSGKLLEKVHQTLREEVPFAKVDRIFHKDIEKAIELIQSDRIIQSIHEDLCDKIDDDPCIFEDEFEQF